MKNVPLKPTGRAVALFLVLLIIIPWPVAMPSRCIDCPYTLFAFPVLSTWSLIFAWQIHTNLMMLIGAVVVSYLLAIALSRKKKR